MGEIERYREAYSNGRKMPKEVADRLEKEQQAAIKFPADGKLLGDWKAGERIAQTGNGMQWSDDPKRPDGGNCYACHQLSKAELSFGTIGPSLCNFGKLRDFTPAMEKYAHSKVYNSQAFSACSSMPRFGHSGILSEQQLTPETALKAAQAALATCRKNGYQVAVVDRAGLTQVLLRDRFAGPHTIEIATNKAWSAVSFRTNTTELEKASRPGQSMSGLRHFPRMTAVGGGMMVEAGGSLLGAIGVSGAPGGDADDVCAAAGIKAIAEELEF